MRIHLIGLGGAGKTTTGKLLAKKLNISCFDLDEYFLEQFGDISAFIDENGYAKYASENVSLYQQIMQNIHSLESCIIVCSSGFMTYAENVVPEYLQLKQDIENDPFTFLLVPSMDLEECIKIIVRRQLKRTYLNTTAEKEEIKVRTRFDIYNNLSCYKVLTNRPVENFIDEIRQWIINSR